MALTAKKISSFVMVELENKGYSLEEIDDMVSSKIRTTDILGVTSDGRIQIIFPQATEEDVKYILPRFKDIDLNIKVLS